MREECEVTATVHALPSLPQHVLSISKHSSPDLSSHVPQLCVSVLSGSWCWLHKGESLKWQALPGMAFSSYVRGLGYRFVNLFAIWWSNSEDCVLYPDSRTHSRNKQFPQRRLVQSQHLYWLLFLPISISLFSTGIFWDHIPEKLPVLGCFLKTNSEGT